VSLSGKYLTTAMSIVVGFGLKAGKIGGSWLIAHRDIEEVVDIEFRRTQADQFPLFDL
jgi:hypothetical protein